MGCLSTSKTAQTDIALQINDCKITAEEFDKLIRFETSVDPEIEMTNEVCSQFVEYLIRKELMIQEASRLELDQSASFIRAIEKYWEATLIKALLEFKSKEIKKTVRVTEDQVKKSFDKGTFLPPDTPYEQAGPLIRKQLESCAVQAKMDQWIRDLRACANIRVNKAFMSTLRADQKTD